MRHILLFVVYTIAAFIIFIYCRFCFLTARYQRIYTEKAEHILKTKTSCVVPYWHGRLLISGTRGFPFFDASYSLSSKNVDATIGVWLTRLMGIKLFRGSTNKITTDILRKIVRMLRTKHKQFFITTDGPVGPRFRVGVGTAQIASMAGCPLLPVTYSAKPAKQLGSWDRFLVPFPFSKVVVSIGDPVETRQPDGSRRSIEEVRHELELELQRITWEADALCGIPRIAPQDVDKRGQKVKKKQ